MEVTFGCVVLKDDRILLVREKSEKHEQLEKWNIVSGKAEGRGEFIFGPAVKREIREETGIDVEVKGVVGIYESITPEDRTVYIVFGCEAKNENVAIGDKDVIDARFFDLKEFWEMTEDEIVHEDMKLVTRNFMDGKVIDLVKSVKYD